MLEILQYVFSSFWIWLGAVILIGSVSVGITRIISAILGTNQITVNTTNNEKTKE